MNTECSMINKFRENPCDSVAKHKPLLFLNREVYHGGLEGGGIGYVSAESVTKNKEIINQYKVYIGKVNLDRGGVNITETYLLLGTFDNNLDANNCASYYRTKFVRVLISLTLTSMNITKIIFSVFPSKTSASHGRMRKYNLTEEEIAFIESMIRPME